MAVELNRGKLFNISKYKWFEQFGIKIINLMLGVKLYKKHKFTNYQSFELMLFINLVAICPSKVYKKENF